MVNLFDLQFKTQTKLIFFLKKIILTIHFLIYFLIETINNITKLNTFLENLNTNIFIIGLIVCKEILEVV